MTQLTQHKNCWTSTPDGYSVAAALLGHGRKASGPGLGVAPGTGPLSYRLTPRQHPIAPGVDAATTSVGA